MGRTASEKLKALAIAGFILGVAYAIDTIFMGALAVVLKSPALDKPVLFGFSAMQVQFWILPLALFVILGYISVLLTQEDRVTIDFTHGPRGGVMKWADEALPILGISSGILAAVFYGTFVVLVGLLSLPSAGLKGLLVDVTLYGDRIATIVFLITRIVMLASIGGTCGLAIFFIAFHKNGISTRKFARINLFTEVILTRPIYTMFTLTAFTCGMFAPVAVPIDPADMSAWWPYDLRLMVFIVLAILASIPLESCIYRLAERFSDVFNERLNITRINTIMALANGVVFFLVMAYPLLVFILVIFLGAG